MKSETRSLKTIFRGAALLLAGFLGGGIMTFGLQVLLARFFQPEIYGLFSQGMSVLYITVMVSLLGLNSGVSRHISFKEREEQEAAKAVGSSLLVVVPISVLMFAGVFLNAEFIAIEIFSDQRMTEVLKIFAFAGPAMAANSILISGFRGHQSSRERVIFLDFIIPLLQILLAGSLIFAGYELGGAVTGYASAFLLSFAGLSYWYSKNYSLSFDPETLRELFRLSWPLMVSAVAVQIFLWSPPLLVGALATSREVGLLNSALPLASSTKMFLSSAAFLYLPVVSELYGKNDLSELRQVHSTTTRWIAYLSLPVLGFFIFRPSMTLSFVFGNSYQAAGLALAAMAAGHVFTSLTGPLGELLIASGKTRREMIANTSKLAIFGTLSLYLIPGNGFLGAGIAYSAGLVTCDLMRLFFAREELGLFYSARFLKPFAAIGTGLLTIFLVPESFLLQLPAWFLAYFTALSLTRPLSGSDRDLIDEALDGRPVPRPEMLETLLDRLSEKRLIE